MKRGQAVVEMVLGTLGLVTLLLVGAYFGEVFFLGLKITEATANPIWDSTAHTFHDDTDHDGTDLAVADHGSATVEVGNKYRGDGSRVNNLYDNFDGRTSDAHNFGRQPFATAKSLDTGVRVLGGDDLGKLHLVYWAPVIDLPSPIFNKWGVVNAGSAVLDSAHIGAFVEGTSNAFFKATQKPAGGMRICAVGRASSGVDGKCQGEMSILLDDWSLIGTEQSTDCTLRTQSERCTGAENHQYWDYVTKLYGPKGTYGKERDYLQTVMGITIKNWASNPSDLNFTVSSEKPPPDFEKSFSTKQTWSVNAFNQADDAAQDWDSTPFLTQSVYHDRIQQRSNCFLGRFNNSTAWGMNCQPP